MTCAIAGTEMLARPHAMPVACYVGNLFEDTEDWEKRPRVLSVSSRLLTRTDCALGADVGTGVCAVYKHERS